MKTSVRAVVRALRLASVVFTIAFAATAAAQTDSTAVDSTAAPATLAPPAAPPSAPPPPAATPAAEPEATPAAEPRKKKQMFYGGTIGLSFGDYTRISVAPQVGWKLTPRVGAGFKAMYEYIEDKRYNPKITASNYGGSVFGRFYPTPRGYAHAEFAYMSYEYAISSSATDRSWVPFLLLGGGIVQPLSPRSAVIIEVLFDVLRDDNSPYEDWTPWVSVGVGVGF
jgi:hypothetical protein